MPAHWLNSYLPFREGAKVAFAPTRVPLSQRRQQINVLLGGGEDRHTGRSFLNLRFVLRFQILYAGSDLLGTDIEICQGHLGLRPEQFGAMPHRLVVILSAGTSKKNAKG